MTDKDEMERVLRGFDPVEHRFRFAAWCGATAARASANCRFTVSEGVTLLEKSKLDRIARGIDELPEAIDFDDHHKVWCSEIVKNAPSVMSKAPRKEFSYGVAAKLVDCYLKPLFLELQPPQYDESIRTRTNAIHPPIDSILLKNLGRRDPDIERSRNWKRWKKMGWSNFDRDTYLEIIQQVRDVTENQLWRIEAFWTGYQSR